MDSFKCFYLRTRDNLTNETSNETRNADENLMLKRPGPRTRGSGDVVLLVERQRHPSASTGTSLSLASLASQAVAPVLQRILPSAARGSLTVAAMSFTARRKIQKEKGQEPDEFEESVAQALFDLESTNSELKSELRDLFINSAKEVDVSGNRKAVIIHVPYRLRKAFQKIHARLVRELEKKFSGKVWHCCF